jgi:hypothetical protein
MTRNELNTDLNNIDFVAIEREARKLRAQAMRDMAGSFRAWLRDLKTSFSVKPGKTA